MARNNSNFTVTSGGVRARWLELHQVYDDFRRTSRDSDTYARNHLLYTAAIKNDIDTDFPLLADSDYWMVDNFDVNESDGIRYRGIEGDDTRYPSLENLFNSEDLVTFAQPIFGDVNTNTAATVPQEMLMYDQNSIGAFYNFNVVLKHHFGRFLNADPIERVRLARLISTGLFDDPATLSAMADRLEERFEMVTQEYVVTDSDRVTFNNDGFPRGPGVTNEPNILNDTVTGANTVVFEVPNEFFPPDAASLSNIQVFLQGVQLSVETPTLTSYGVSNVRDAGRSDPLRDHDVSVEVATLQDPALVNIQDPLFAPDGTPTDFNVNIIRLTFAADVVNDDIIHITYLTNRRTA